MIAGGKPNAYRRGTFKLNGGDGTNKRYLITSLQIRGHLDDFEVQPTYDCRLPGFKQIFSFITLLSFQNYNVLFITRVWNYTDGSFLDPSATAESITAAASADANIEGVVVMFIAACAGLR